MPAGYELARTLTAGRRPGPITRAVFVSRMSAILGANQRILYVPNGTDTTTSVESSTVGRTFTWDGDISSRVSRVGNGYVQSFNGTTQYGAMADAADLSFGNGTTDSAFSVLALVNVTDTSAVRNLIAKTDTSNREWRFGVLTNGTMIVTLWDESAAAAASRISTGAVTTGAWTLLGFTYDGTGGATAANGITIYQDGEAVASAATNNASYVAMENLTSTAEIGARISHTQDWLLGQLGLIALTQKALTASEHAQAWLLSRRLLGLGQ